MGLSSDTPRERPGLGVAVSSRSGIVRSKSDDGEAKDGDFIPGCSSSSSSLFSLYSSPIRLHSLMDVNSGNVDNFNKNKHTNGQDNGFLVDSQKPTNGSSPKVTAVSLSKPPSGKNNKKLEMNGSDSTNSNGTLNGNCSNMSVGEDVDCNGVDRGDTTCVESTRARTFRNLDDGKEFELGEDGMGNKLKEVGTGRQLTMEEFDMSIGHSPIVQELMRRQNVEDGSKENADSIANGGIGVGVSKLKKKGSWFKSIRSVAGSVSGHKERRSSDERDTGSEKGGRRSSSATDDSQDGAFHGLERVRVRQYGKSCKELSALYKSQEIQAHNGSIWSIKFSLDGRYLASAGEDCVIHVWQVVESERRGELLMEKPEDGNFNLLMANGSPEPTLLSPTTETLHDKKRRGRPSISRKSLSLDRIVLPETVFAFTDKPVCSFQGHLDDVLDLSWSKSQVSE
uniref:WD repeat-containing protein 44 isoform X1 n=1 Tax=Rhizophora mucronata TaxID=61149 RepID=A0A2P2K3L6_RHIMU